MIPLITGQVVAFWIFAPLSIAGALGMVIARKPVHSAISLAGMMVALGCLYASLDAPFLFVAQIIVYTGAILMLFLFVVMLVGVDSRDSVVEVIKGHRIASIVTVVALVGLMLVAFSRNLFSTAPATVAAANAEQGGNLQSVAVLLFTRYVFIFEATAALLITAAVGAMVLAHGERIREKKSQVDSAAERIERYSVDGVHPGPLPNSGVFARSNAIHTPALLPDGTVAETSVSQTLAARGVIVDVDDLRVPTETAFGAIDASQARARGEVE